MIYYPNPVRAGTDAIKSLGDGTTINVSWFEAGTTIQGFKTAYNIYYSVYRDEVFAEGIKYVSIDGALNANIIDLVPGQLYYFCVRPVEYDPNIFDLSLLPIAYDNLRVYPTSILRQDISATSLIIPLLTVDEFPSTGIIKAGYELIQYLAVDQVNNNLVLSNISQRGYDNTPITLHTVDGYDGYNQLSPVISLFTLTEGRLWDRVFECQSRFEYPNFPFTLVDGYHQVITDLLSTDLTAADAANVTFPEYCYSGYNRTDPVLLLNGACVGSYMNNCMCVDGYGNVNQLSGFSLQAANTQRQDVLLSITGRPAVLIRRVQTGITCTCYLPSSEYQDDRCPYCYGTKFVFGYEQYFNPRSSDGRIQVRADPTAENLKMYEAGLESEYPLNLWTLTVPTIKTRDVLVLFDQDDNEEFRYEVAAVTRNNTINGLDGGQHLASFRVRKFDPIYQIRIFRNTADFPRTLNTSIGFTPGIAPHQHSIVVNEKTLSIGQINQTTGLSQGHNHPIVNGNVMTVLSHSHQIILM